VISERSRKRKKARGSRRWSRWRGKGKMEWLRGRETKKDSKKERKSEVKSKRERKKEE
jgi:hypothetical protein